MKKVLLFVALFFAAGWLLAGVHAATPVPPSLDIPPVMCPKGSCPADLIPIYTQKGEKCAYTFDEFKQNPALNHYWIEDQEITAQGRTDERAREFIAWAVNKNAIDDHPILKKIWTNTSTVAYFFTVLIAAILGFGLIISQRAHFNTSIKVWPIVGKIAGVLLGIALSATLVIVLIQLSEVFMKFFAEHIGGANLFNIYFSGASKETNYTNFIGCRDLNLRVQEGTNAEMFMLKITNVTYYAMGIMLILRKIILWFMLFVSPFIPILFTFPFIRNTAWIWVGVFFQWLFYGPLFALFLGGVALIWSVGIPFTFNFSRAGTSGGYIYPTSINILYGGPAQQLGALNNGNYIDTFAEYIISLIMLWAVTIFPWFLLRIFRDYCCDGINATKNILLSMYDQMRGGNPLQPSPTVSPASTMGTAIKMQKDVETSVRTRLETVEEIHNTKTEDITRSLNLQAKKLTDIARMETNKQTQESVKRNLDLLSNPIKADTPTERQKYMNLRTELFNRAVKEDRMARQVLVATSVSKVDQFTKRQELLQGAPQLTPSTHVISVKLHLPQDKISSVNRSFVDAVSKSSDAMMSLAQSSQLTVDQIHAILQSYKDNISGSSYEMVKHISRVTGLPTEKVVIVLKQTPEIVEKHADLAKQIAEKEQISQSQVNEVIAAQAPLVAEPEKNVEQTIAIPPTISIEDYEDVKKMWIEQYEKGEVPVTENMTSRKQWVEKDIVFITNTLNKILSTDTNLKQQGLEDLAYILPIFLINDLKGEELVVYMKAKLEAAKQVSMNIDKEKNITSRLEEKSKDELVDVDRQKTGVNENTMEMKQELGDNPK